MTAFTRWVAFDGGGVGGEIALRMYLKLKKRIPYIEDFTDGYACTSVGAIIGAGLAAKAKTSEEIETIFRTRAKDVFTPTWGRWLTRFWGLERARFSSDNLYALVTDVVGKEDLRMGELKRKLFITSLKLSMVSEAEEPPHWEAVFFDNLKDSAYLNMRVVDAVMSSSAAPVVFPSWKIQSDACPEAKGDYVDGGLTGQNNPTMALVERLDSAEIDERPIPVVISLGCGKKAYTAEGGDQGLAYWGPRIISMILDVSVRCTTRFARRRLGERFYRLNIQLPFDYSLEEYEKIPEMVNLVDQMMVGESLEEHREKYWKSI